MQRGLRGNVEPVVCEEVDKDGEGSDAKAT